MRWSVLLMLLFAWPAHAESNDYRVWVNGIGGPAFGPFVDWMPLPVPMPDQGTPTYVSPTTVAVTEHWIEAGTQGANVAVFMAGFDASSLEATYDTTKDAGADDAQKNGAITQALYTFNWLHDFWARAGFDAPRIQVQVDDPNTPYYAVTMDASPRIALGIGAPRAETSLTAAPGGAYPSSFGSFGVRSFNLSASLVWVGTGCTGLGASVAGKVALADRGGCSDLNLALNAWAAGALGLIIVNQIDERPTLTANVSVNLPILGVAFHDGVALESLLQNGAVSVTMQATGHPSRDFALDGTLAGHAFAHVMFDSLVASCDSVECIAAREGIADIVGLLAVIDWDDDLGGVFPFGMYALPATVDRDEPYYASRRYPYARDNTINPTRFSDLFAVQQDRYVLGQVFGEMLWDGWVAIDRSTNWDAARDRFAAAIVGGLGNVGANPTTLELRDAIVKAADPGDRQALWQAFAGRGAGACATDPVGFDYHANARLVITEMTLSEDTNSCDDDGIVDVDEVGRGHLVVVNASPIATGEMPVTWRSSDPNLVFDEETITYVGLEPYEERVIDVFFRVNAAVGATVGVEVVVDAQGACDKPSARSMLRTDVDLEPNTSELDDFAIDDGLWHVAGTPGTWARVQPALDDVRWSTPALEVVSDASLIGPTVSAGSAFLVQLDEAHRFFGGDHGALERSVDGGPWTIVATFTGTSEAHPALSRRTIDFGDTLAGHSVTLRFNLVTDAIDGSEGWSIDDVRIAGTTPLPFPGAFANACPDIGPDPDPETSPELVAEPDPDPSVEPAPEPALEPAPESDPEPAPEPEPAAEATVETTTTAEAEPTKQGTSDEGCGGGKTSLAALGLLVLWWVVGPRTTARSASNHGLSRG